MAYDPATYKVNLDTPQPDGRKGESPRNAFTKYNALVDALKNAPPAPASTTTNNVPQWSNTTGTLKDGLAVTSSTTDGTTGKLMRVGDFGLSGEAINVESIPLGNYYENISFFKWNDTVPTGAPDLRYSVGIHVSRNAVSWAKLIMAGGTTVESQRLFLQSRSSAGLPDDYVEFVSTANTQLIVSSGSNANGQWVQFADGTQICYIVDSSNVVTTDTPTGNIYFSLSIDLTFPKSFLSPPAVTISANYNNSWVWPGYARDVTSSSFSARLYGSLNTAKGYVSAVAIGRWK